MWTWLLVLALDDDGPDTGGKNLDLESEGAELPRRWAENEALEEGSGRRNSSARRVR